MKAGKGKPAFRTTAHTPSLQCMQQMGYCATILPFLKQEDAETNSKITGSTIKEIQEHWLYILFSIYQGKSKAFDLNNRH